MNRHARGFTLIELMVVLSIILTMTVMMVPIFSLTTRTVKTVQRKLEVYEAARMILDLYEAEVQQAWIGNERGECFAIKNFHWDDTDAFTPAGNKPFAESRRESDSVMYIKHQPGSDKYSGGTYTGSMHYPLLYPPNYFEATVGWLGGGLQYKKNSSSVGIEPFLADISKIETSFYGNGIVNPVVWKAYPAPTDPNKAFPRDEPQDFLAPGHMPWEKDYVVGDDFTISGIFCMDLDIEFWDAQAKLWRAGGSDVKFDDTAIYISPPPKALKFTITVCDRNKQSRVTLSRIVYLPGGSGRAAVDPNQTSDTIYFAPGTSQYNRKKDLKVLDPKMYGL